MPATVTLSTTTLTKNARASDGLVQVASPSGLAAGIRLFVDREAMSVVSLEVDNWVKVLRGSDGTAAAPHFAGATAYIARGDQLYTEDPVGAPSEAVPVSPHINVVTGTVWFAQGDALSPEMSQRWWQAQTTTYGTGALGVRTTTLDPTSST